jgi:hypothetical protein
MAMLQFFRTPFAVSGDKNAIPNDSQPDGSVSYTDGFGVDYELDPGANPSAKDVPRDETNQLYYAITNAIKEYQEFGTPDFITSVLNGGSPFSYDKWARVRYETSPGVFNIYESRKDANTSLPTVAADWRLMSDNLNYLAIATTAFEASVTDGEAVYWDSTNSRFDEAVADGTSKQNVIGFADVTNSRVYVYGQCGLFSGLTGNVEYFLSPVTPGALTSVRPTTNAVSVGVSKDADEIFVNVQLAGTTYLSREYMLVRDEKPQGTNGGTSLTGNNIRVLNTTVANTIVGASLGSNQITLPAGTYRIRAEAPTAENSVHRAQFYNVTDATIQILGTSRNGTTDIQDFATVWGRFTITSTKVFELRHQMTAGVATRGLGDATNMLGVEVYSQVEIIKEI